MPTTSVIHCDPEIMSGLPVFVGTRVPVQSLMDYLAAGQTLEEFLDDFPAITKEKATAALRESAQLWNRHERPA